jgi:hypothetical protein
MPTLEKPGSLVGLAASSAVREREHASGQDSQMEHERLFDVSAALVAWDERETAGYWLATWSDKSWMNTPGPLYCGNGDNCGTGPLYAPNNVQQDPEGFEVIFRQPVNRFELQQVIWAATVDPLHGYGCDGDTHWSVQAIRTWWAEQRHEVEVTLMRELEAQRALGSARDYQDHAYSVRLGQWLEYLRHEALPYLQLYAFFLEEGHLPDGDAVLPTL